MRCKSQPMTGMSNILSSYLRKIIPNTSKTTPPKTINTIKPASSNAKNKILNAEYKISSEEIDTALNKVKNSETLTERDNYVYTEVVSHITEELLGNEESINRLARENRTLAQKILNRIKDFIKAFKGTNANKETIEKLQKAEKMFESALSRLGKDRKAFEEKGYKLKAQYDKEKKEYQKLSEDKRESWLKEKGYQAEDFNDDVSEDNELDNSSEIRYSNKINDDGENFQKYYNPKIKNLLTTQEWKRWYNKRAEYIAGAKFVKIDDNILIPISGTKIVVTDIAFSNPYAKEVLVATNFFDGDAQILIDYIDKGVSNYGYSIQEIWKLATNVYGETLFNIHNGATGLNSENIGGWEFSNRQNDRTVQENEDGNGITKGIPKTNNQIKFSHKDSQGRVLNKAQQDFFKDSKVVDENGNLRVVYHGTVGEFYTFDKTYLGSATGVGDAKLGFFFTSNENVALEYAINAHDTKFFILTHKIANGDNDRRKNI